MDSLLIKNCKIVNNVNILVKSVLKVKTIVFFAKKVFYYMKINVYKIAQNTIMKTNKLNNVEFVTMIAKYVLGKKLHWKQIMNVIQIKIVQMVSFVIQF